MTELDLLAARGNRISSDESNIGTVPLVMAKRFGPSFSSALLRWLDIAMASVASGYARSPRSTPAATSVEHSWDLLLAASSAVPREALLARMRDILQSPVDWQALLRLADHHGASYVLHEKLSSLSAEVPPAILSSLRVTYQSNVQRSLLLARELFRILDCLDEHGIEAIPYKGLVLSELYYGDIAMRQAGDNDVFIRRRDIMRAKDAMHTLGYKPREPIPAAAEQDYLSYGYECAFDSPAGKNLLELQWALEPRFYSVDYDMDELFARAVKVTVAGRQVKTPSPEDLVLVLSVHAAKHAWGRLMWLCDIARIVQRQSLNWQWIQEQTLQLGVERIVHITLLLVKNLLGTEIPVRVQRELDADHAAQEFARQFAAQLAAGASHGELGVGYFWLTMRLRERPSDRWKFLTRLAFTPGPGEWDAMRLPKPLFPLYRVVRLARLAARLTGG